MASSNSMVALVISVAALGVVVWAMTVSERSRSIYGHAVPESYAASAPLR